MNICMFKLNLSLVELGTVDNGIDVNIVDNSGVAKKLPINARNINYFNQNKLSHLCLI